MVNVNRHFKMLPTYYLNFNYSKFPEEAHDLEINKKKSWELWENKNREGDSGTWKTQGTKYKGHVR